MSVTTDEGDNDDEDEEGEKEEKEKSVDRVLRAGAGMNMLSQSVPWRW